MEQSNSENCPPLHVAIIMDGNGRWANARGLPRTAGHKKGAEAVQRCVESSIELGVTHLTLFGFSTENWKRPESEVGELMGLLRFYLKREIAKLHKNGVRFCVIGQREPLAPDIVKLIEEGEAKTLNNDKLVLTIALSYGSRDEIISATKAIAQKVKSGEIAVDDINEDLMSSSLFTKNLPEPDLLIRTSGEQRISNFLLWQLAYTELFFTDIHWPDFDKNELARALGNFNRRERRYGAVSA